MTFQRFRNDYFFLGSVLLGAMQLGLLAVLLFTSNVFAQDVARGDALRKRQYETQSTMTLYVDGALGNDASACTSAGAGACASIQAAVNKLPRFIAHNTTIEIAAGTYDPFEVSDLWVSDGYALTFNGAALMNATLPSGTATGTLTGYTPNTVPTRPVATDTGQSWPATGTSQDILQTRGYFFTITGGTGAGQTRVIAQSSPTAMTLVSTFTTAPTAGSTYAIQTPSVIVFRDTNPALTMGLASGSFVFNNMQFETDGASTIVNSSRRPTASSRWVFNFCRVFSDSNSTTTSVLLNNAPTAFAMLDSSIVTTGTGGGGELSTTSFSSGTITLLRMYVQGQRGAVAINNGALSLTDTSMDSRNTTQTIVLFMQGPRNVVSLFNISCTGPISAMIGVQMNGAGTVSAGTVTGCGIGLLSNGRLTYNNLELRNLNAGGTGIVSTSPNGGVVVTGGGTIAPSAGSSTLTFSGNGADAGIDFYNCGDTLSSGVMAAFPAGARHFSSPCGTIITN